MSGKAKDRFLMDSHKLLWHLDRIVDSQAGKRIAPLHIDVGLSKGCNIRCHYCYGATQGNLYQKGKNVYFPREPLLRYMREAGAMGVRSMALIGEAEPLINPHVYEAIAVGKKAGVDLAMGTNGILFDTGRQGEQALELLTWLRFNVSAASEEAYRRLHGSAEFKTLIEKIKFCVARKRQRKLPIAIGLQMVLTPQDADEVVPLARLGKSLGVDYLEIKHCSDTQDNRLHIYQHLASYGQFDERLQQAEAESTDDFAVIVKWANINSQGKRDYDACLGAPFLLYSTGEGLLYPCGQFFSYRSKEFLLGNLVTGSFKQIVESDHYWKVMDKVRCGVDVHKECYAFCRTNAINSFLWRLAHKPEHVNFV
ncbi:MAG: radical SAM protein [Lentisphaerae bacterium]|nr:radical SAM protein [Lentisphaerota bacterium]